MSIADWGQPMVELVSRALVLLWAACVFLQSLAAGQAPGGRDTRGPSRPGSQAPKPRGLEYRRVRRLGGRVLAVRLQVILA